jgi:hypothetical protein
MEIFKTYYKFQNGVRKRNTGKILFILRTDLYDNSLDYFLQLFAEAKKDFPNLTQKDVICREYGGRTVSGLRGIEFYFDPPKKGSTKTVKIPKGYEDNYIIYPIK